MIYLFKIEIMKIVGNVVIFGGDEPFGKCEYCGKEAELRPYGKGGAKICFECGMKPEDKAETDRQFEGLLSQVKPINPNDN
jgi:hypothetical protein